MDHFIYLFYSLYSNFRKSATPTWTILIQSWKCLKSPPGRGSRGCFRKWLTSANKESPLMNPFWYKNFKLPLKLFFLLDHMLPWLLDDFLLTYFDWLVWFWNCRPRFNNAESKSKPSFLKHFMDPSYNTQMITICLFNCTRPPLENEAW